jgi:outer membrane scaffolding protein for murein synthesis (MipA/OmpV family)
LQEQVVKRAIQATIGGMVLAAVAGVAQAADPPQPLTFFGYAFNASIEAVVAPSYEGGKNFAAFPGGSLAITKPWQFDSFSAQDDAASFGFLNTKHFQFGAALSLRNPRYNNDELKGMRSIGWALMGGGYVNYWPTRYARVHVEALKGLTSEYGWTVNTGMDFVAHPNKWNLSIGPRYSWGDDDFMSSYFGVTPAEAQASPYITNPFHAHAGSHYAGIATMAEYKWKPRWRLTMDASYHHLMGDAERSPLVRQIGTPEQFQFGAGLRFMLQDTLTQGVLSR